LVVDFNIFCFGFFSVFSVLNRHVQKLFPMRAVYVTAGAIGLFLKMVCQLKANPLRLQNGGILSNG